MKRVSPSRHSAALGLAGACASGPVKRVGMVIQLRPEKLEEYKRLHADSNPGVRDLLVKYHLRNFSIFLQQIDGKWYEFGYYEYTGKDFEADMARLANDRLGLPDLRRSLAPAFLGRCEERLCQPTPQI